LRAGIFAPRQPTILSCIVRKVFWRRVEPSATRRFYL
jgi:hypothetical protein